MMLAKWKKYTGQEELDAVKEDGQALRYVNKQTEEICLAAVKQDGFALQYINNQTEEICLAAVRQCSYALQYVEKYYESVANIVNNDEYSKLGAKNDSADIIKLNGVKYKRI